MGCGIITQWWGMRGFVERYQAYWFQNELCNWCGRTSPMTELKIFFMRSHKTGCAADGPMAVVRWFDRR